MTLLTCIDCLYESVCPNCDAYNDILNISNYCPNFKNKSDVVEVIRCKDCKKSRGSGCPFWDEAPYNKEDYCSYGERKDTK